MGIKTLLFIGLLMVFSCKAGDQSKSVNSSSDKDLTKYMYKSKNKTAVVATPTQEKESMPVQFEKQVNATVNAVIDSMAVSNKRYQSASGYRIMVYSGSSSQESSDAKKAIYGWSTEYNVYVQYKQPAFRVKVGNFPDRIKAYDVLSDIIKLYPNAVIIPDQIEIK